MDGNRIIRDHFTFRVILQGMSHPGKIYALTGSPTPSSDTGTSPRSYPGKKAPLPNLPGAESAVIEILGCLMDNEVSFAVIGDKGMETVIARHTDSRPVSLEDADYIIVLNGTTRGKLAGFKRGSLEYPDTGATILYLVEALSEATGVVLSGPGVNGTVSLRITGLDPSELQLLRQVNSEFPLGVDAIFLDQSGQIACIPRSSRIGVN
ncbi:MAG: phosphonate C-P lyase system protein PhnH [Pseudomonadota bacterium]